VPSDAARLLYIAVQWGCFSISLATCTLLAKVTVTLLVADVELCSVEVDKSLSGDEIPERDMTFLLAVYLVTTELRITHPLPEHSSKYNT